MLEQISAATRRDKWGHEFAMFRCSDCGREMERRLRNHGRHGLYCRGCAARHRREFERRYLSACHGKALICQVVAALVGAKTQAELAWCAEFSDGFVQGDRSEPEPAYRGPLDERCWQFMNQNMEDVHAI